MGGAYVSLFFVRCLVVKSSLVGCVSVAGVLLLAACGGAGEGASSASPSESSVSAAVSASASPVSVAEAQALGAGWELTETGVRTADGYHLNTVTEGVPTVILYTDLQCPYCAVADEAYAYAAVELDGVLNVTVKHFPLPFHTNAVPAAQAVQAAEAQGKHAQMASYLFEHQEEWSGITDKTALVQTLTGYAEAIGLDREQFEADLSDEDQFKIIQREYNDGKATEVPGTPSFTIDGKVLEDVDSSTGAEEMVAAFKDAAGI